MLTKKTDSKNQRLRAMITSPELSFLMESHNALSAKIAEEAGFSGLYLNDIVHFPLIETYQLRVF